MTRIRIIVDEADLSMTGELDDSETAKAIAKALPLEGSVQTWGEEVYFETKVKLPEENAHSEVPSGTLAYWTPGHAFCVFFGQEPFSPVNVIGKVDGDPKHFAAAKSGQVIRVEQIVEATKAKKK